MRGGPGQGSASGGDTPVYYAALLIDLMREDFGVEARRVLHETGLEAAHLADARGLVANRSYRALVRNALALAREPGLGLRLGCRETLERHGVYAYAILSSANLGRALQLMARHSRVGGSLAGARLEDDAREMVLALQDTTGLGDLESFAVEEFLASLRTWLPKRDGSASAGEIRVAYPAPPHAALYERLFDYPVRFGCGVTQFRFGASLLRASLACAHPAAAQICQRQCERILPHLEQRGGLVDRIRRLLVTRPGHFPDTAAMASELACSPRTLRRGLRAEGISYRGVVEGVRKALALDYLRNSALRTEEIAERLGYTEPSNFRRAFRRWTGSAFSASQRASAPV